MVIRNYEGFYPVKGNKKMVVIYEYGEMFF